MKTVWMFLLLAAVLTATPVTVTGAGDFSFSGSSGGWEVSFSGGTGDLVSGGSFNGTSGSPLNGILSGMNTYSAVGALVDGQYFAPGFVFFLIGDEGGYIEGFDSRYQVVAEQDLIAAITVTSETCTAIDQCAGAFSVHAPEPGSAGLVLLGMLAGLWFIVRHRVRKVNGN